jgi:uncharacterized protein (DUF58 family)
VSAPGAAPDLTPPGTPPPSQAAVTTSAGRAPAAAPAPARGSRAWWAGTLPVPTLRAGALVAVLGVAVLLVPIDLPVWPLLALVPAPLVLDAALAPAPWTVGVGRTLPAVLPLDGRGVLRWEVTNPTRRRLHVALADELAPSLGAGTRRVGLRVAPSGRAHAATTLSPRRRGTFEPSQITVRVTGPLGLATRQAPRSVPGRVEVHPSFRSRDAAELRIRRARILEQGQRSVRGRGGGTEFEALRDYVDGDEFRRVDWAATARRGHPVVRTYRAERNQTVLVLLDTGRVVAGLVEGVPRLDHGMDAALALATVATRSGDRAGLVAFGGDVRAVVPPRRDAAQLRRLSSAMHALEPELAESGYREAFRTTLARFRRRALLVVITELAAEAVQETLVPALPLVVREHAVLVASVRDPELERLRDAATDGVADAYAAAAAANLLAERERAAARLRALGAHVVDAPPGELAAALADAYLDVKARGAL